MALQTTERVGYPRALDTSLVVRQANPITQRSPELFDRVRGANRLRYGRRSAEDSYTGWIRQFPRKRPGELGAAEVIRCLSPLAVEDKVAASKPNLNMGATSTPCTSSSVTTM